MSGIGLRGRLITFDDGTSLINPCDVTTSIFPAVGGALEESVAEVEGWSVAGGWSEIGELAGSGTGLAGESEIGAFFEAASRSSGVAGGSGCC